MSILPLADCARLLGIHPKTLRSYLKRANMALTPHPTDARIKCLTDEQVQSLSTLSGRQVTSASQQTQAEAREWVFLCVHFPIRSGNKTFHAGEPGAHPF